LDRLFSGFTVYLLTLFKAIIMKNITKIHLVSMLVFTLFSAAVLAHGDEKKQANPDMFSGLQTQAAKTVIAFNNALETGDVQTARELLADDVLILEGKGVERSAQQYASHHMLSDMKYLKEMSIATIEHHVTQSGDLAFSISRSTVKGTYKDKDVDRQGNETMMLEKQNGQWKIKHIHWSH
jgi:ketosteroid isomerase-like protein